MLEVKELTKIFKSDKNTKTIALDKVSFKLPNKGFVFIVGKSGSGKTTLLSLLGGLEDITSGKIIFDNKDFKSFKRKEFDTYRNNEVGFIFQDYHLLEELTIFDNIKMMLDFKEIDDDEKIHQALKDVGLEGYELRCPKELSGGEKQRVAIARIIVKNPSIILADEPTGNLDRNTTKQVFDLLKKMSTEKLVIAVSHSTIDAYVYADYILELNEGKIINKYKKKENQKDSFRVENDILYVAKDRKITENEVKSLKTALKSIKISDVNQSYLEFEKYNEDFINEEIPNLDSKKHIKFFKSIKYSFKFFKGNILKSFILSLVSSIIIACTASVGLLMSTNIDKTINNYISKSNINDQFIVPEQQGETIDNKVIDEYKKYGKVYNTFSNIFPNDLDKSSISSQTIYDLTRNNKIIVVDDEFIDETFKYKNEPLYLIKRDVELPYGLYVTDVLVDSFFEVPINYEEVLEKGLTYVNTHVEINGVINTCYKEKYPYASKILNNLDLSKKIDPSKAQEVTNFYTEMSNSFMQYYTKNPNWLDAMLNEPSYYFLPGHCIAKTSNKNLDLFNFNEWIFTKYFELKDNEILLSLDNYRYFEPNFTYYGANYLFEKPFEIKVEFFNRNDRKYDKTLATRTLKVVGLNKSANFGSRELITSVTKEIVKVEGLMLKDIKDLNAVAKLNEKNNYFALMHERRTAEQSVKFTEVLTDFFIFIFVVLVFISFLLIYLYNSASFKSRLFETGVMKALGARDVDIINSMLVNFISTLLITLVLSNLFTLILTPIINKFLTDGIRLVSGEILASLPNVPLIFIDSTLLIGLNLAILGSFIVTFLFQFIKLRILKPINIIKAKE